MADPAFIAATEAVFSERNPIPPEVAEQQMLDAADPIVQRLQQQASEAVSKRAEIEQRWIEDLRQFAGVRIGEQLNKDGTKASTPQSEQSGSTIFVNITRPKTWRTEGRLFDILFPADDKNWGIQPTPVPELITVAKRAPEEADRARAEQMQTVDALNRHEDRAADPNIDADAHAQQRQEMVAQAADLGVKADDLASHGADAQAAMDKAKHASELMSREIDDQLTQSRYAKESRDAIGWACKLGTGILKGPVVNECSRKGWQQPEDQGAGWKLSMSQDIDPGAKNVRPWDFFPDPSATSMADCEYAYERHLPSKGELRKMAKKLGFARSAVRTLLDMGPDQGSSTSMSHLQLIRGLTGETTPVTNRYVLWEYHGPLETNEIAILVRAQGGEMADQMAQEIEAAGEALETQNVICYFCNSKLLKISPYYPMDSGRLIYDVYSLEKGEASVLGGIGIPRMMKDSQEALNAGWRMMMDNGALSVGPQILIDKGAVLPADGDWTLAPRKVWIWDSSTAQQKTPFEVFNIPMNQEQIAGIITLAMQFIDEETALPRVAEGGGNPEQAAGVAQTVGGLAMLMNSAGVNVRRMVKNWDDDITAPLIERFYDWNMQYSDKPEIKGDMTIEARGTSALLEREAKAQDLATMAQTWSTHPVLSMMVKAYDLARQAVQARSINPDDVLIPFEEYDKKVKDAAQQAPAEDPQWGARKEIAQIAAEARIKTAEITRDTEIVRLSETSKISVAQIQADLAKTKMGTDSKERALAVEVSVEQRNKQEAEAKGMEPTGSGGAISMGEKQAVAA